MTRSASMNTVKYTWTITISSELNKGFEGWVLKGLLCDRLFILWSFPASLTNSSINVPPSLLPNSFKRNQFPTPSRPTRRNVNRFWYETKTEILAPNSLCAVYHERPLDFPGDHPGETRSRCELMHRLLVVVYHRYYLLRHLARSRAQSGRSQQPQGILVTYYWEWYKVSTIHSSPKVNSCEFRSADVQALVK